MWSSVPGCRSVTREQVDPLGSCFSDLFGKTRARFSLGLRIPSLLRQGPSESSARSLVDDEVFAFGWEKQVYSQLCAGPDSECPPPRPPGRLFLPRPQVVSLRHVPRVQLGPPRASRGPPLGGFLLSGSLPREPGGLGPDSHSAPAAWLQSPAGALPGQPAGRS